MDNLKDLAVELKRGYKVDVLVTDHCLLVDLIDRQIAIYSEGLGMFFVTYSKVMDRDLPDLIDSKTIKIMDIPEVVEAALSDTTGSIIH